MPANSESAVPRAAASVNLAATVVACLAAALLLPGLPRASNERAAKAPEPVRVVDAPASGKPCAEQSWPYLDAQCLKRAPEPAIAVAAAPAVNLPVTPAPQSVLGASTAELSPLTAVPATSWTQTSPAPAASDAAAAPPPPSTDYTRTFTAGSAVVEPAEVEDTADEPPLPAPRPKQHRRHRSFHPFSFLGIRF